MSRICIDIQNDFRDYDGRMTTSAWISRGNEYPAAGEQQQMNLIILSKPAGLAVIALVLALSGCRKPLADIETAEFQNSTMRRAHASMQAGDMATALELYQQVLMEDPGAAAAHLQLALIYHDHTKDYIEAIHHYRRYLALRPGSDKEEMIAGRIQKADQLLATQSVRKISANDPSGQFALMQQVDRLNASLAGSQAEKTRLMETNALLSREIVEMNNRIKRLELWVDRLQTSTGVMRNGTRRAQDGTITGANAAHTYEVKQGDSLSHIAGIVYGDPTLWPRIRDANPEKVTNGERVRVGDILKIP